jgi:hypothetical protein
MKKIFLPLLLLFAFTACKHSHEHGSAEHDHSEAEHKEHSHEGHDTDGHNHDSDTKEAVYVHTVLFWMKEDLSAEEAKFFEDGLEKLGKTVPSIVSYKWGRPAGTDRAVVDNSYTYAWIVDFEDAESLNAYEVDPIHTSFVDEAKHLWTKVQVYDTILE